MIVKMMPIAVTSLLMMKMNHLSPALIKIAPDVTVLSTSINNNLKR
jgi:hypothetical protein